MPSCQWLARSLPTPWPRVTMDSIFRQALLFSALFLAFGGDKALAQGSNVTCLPGFDWALNSAKETPCKVASELQAVCVGGGGVPPLPPGGHYIGPVNGDDRNSPNYCICTSIVYGLVSACAACQNGTFISYPAWTVDCTNISTVEGMYRPSLIPSGTLVPRWAYLKPSSYGGLFNIEIAKQIGDRPESSQMFSSSTTSSGAITTDSTPTTSKNSITTPSTTNTYPSTTTTIMTTTTTRSGGGGGSSNTGPIVGGAVGGVVGLGLVAVLAAWVLKRWSGKPPSQKLALSGPSLNNGSTRPLSMAAARQPASQEPYFMSPTNELPRYNIQYHGYSGAPEP
ncbi:uncharacterized protein EI90DRAFT_3285711 [Cantharellus anzutake]|uniref:uncharacterized protein n=1 Tax=Cantharellus anzutake TaxID=1750568 RepID=UPI001908CBAC|nr:uncharacterized protein EI90DRAFT_3285711 [Cantharellus anzutake]KAF8341667.1 hypothetical protein EI90DRAFT_3285711 [Cantharellus anzutake]